jgi:hypothetical protein
MAAAIVEGRVLIDSRPDLADVHLDALPRDRPAVTPLTLSPAARPLEDLFIVSEENSMKGIERQDNLVLSDQFIAELFHAQAALSTQREDDCLLVREHLLSGEAMWSSAFLDEATLPTVPQRQNNQNAVFCRVAP